MHNSFIDSLLINLCAQPRTFEFISKNMKGLDPTEIHRKLCVLENDGKIEKKADLWRVKQRQNNSLVLPEHESYAYLKEYMGYFDFLKLPHPLDFEWRHSTSSLNTLLNIIISSSSNTAKILLLGMPTLFATAVLKDIPQKITLVERNKPIVRGLAKFIIGKKRFKIYDLDIFKVEPNRIGIYQFVFMDPPWYSKYFYQFMWLAAQCVELGGFVGISLPSIITRPKVDSERIKWFSFCQKNGLYLENLYSNKLHYAMPFFEYNAFRAAGIKDIYPFWRKGDLALFRKIHSGVTNRTVIREDKTEWVEKEYDNVRIRMKIENNKMDRKEIEIKHLVKGDILPTVSSRDKIRKNANLWTTGNRIFKINNSKKLLKLLNSDVNGNSNSKELNYVQEFFHTIIELEKKEYNNYLEWLYYEMEKQVD